MPDMDPGFTAAFSARWGERGEPAFNRTIDKLSDAAQLLKTTVPDKEALAAERIDNPELRKHLAALLLAVRKDWAEADALRRFFAGHDEPYGHAEQAATAVARVILGEPEPEKPQVPEMDELLAGLPENYPGDPQ